MTVQKLLSKVFLKLVDNLRVLEEGMLLQILDIILILQKVVKKKFLQRHIPNHNVIKE